MTQECIEVEVFVAPLAIHVNVEVERGVPGLELSHPQPDWFFRFFHVLVGRFCCSCCSFSFEQQNNNKYFGTQKEKNGKR